MDITNGLVYPPGLLDVLPVLHSAKDKSRNRPHRHPLPQSQPQPIRALSASQFADFHLQHTLAHPPDNTLFPFLHGLEGDNHAQNTFFASSSFAAAAGSGSAGARQHQHHQHQHSHQHDPNARITPKVPNYRGLVWVVCEEDLEREGDYTSLRVLRRKPVVAPATTTTAAATASSAATTATGSAAAAIATAASASDEHDAQDLDAACAPSSSDSSTEDCSDDSSSYGDDDDDEIEGEREEGRELVLDEDEQDMLLMLQATGDAAASLAPSPPPPLPPVGGSASPASASKAKIATPGQRLGLNQDGDADPNEDEDEDSSEDSVLASPVLHTSMHMMQVDAVHVVSSPASETDGIAITLEEEGIGANDGNGKDERNYEGTHMHPVAHRPAAAAAVPPPALHAGPPSELAPPLPLPLGLGIDTSAAATNAHAKVIAASSSLAGLSPLSPLSSSSSSSSDSSASTSSSSSSSVSSSFVASPASSWASPVSNSPLSKEVGGGVGVEEGQGEGAGEALSLLELELDSRSRETEPLSASPSSAQEELERGSTTPGASGASSSSLTPAPAPPASSSSSASASVGASSTAGRPDLPRAGSTARNPATTTTTAVWPPSQPKATDPTQPPLLTSTFRPKELLRRVRGGDGVGAKMRVSINGNGNTKMDRGGRNGGLRIDVSGFSVGVNAKKSQGVDGEEEEEEEEEERGWEFVPARVPDGISLRNFGIQVPIYATLSDIVVYSPYGATPAALALARRFKTAIRAKRAERLRAAGLDDASISAAAAMAVNSASERPLSEQEEVSSASSGSSSGSSFGPVFVDDREDQRHHHQHQNEHQHAHDEHMDAEVQARARVVEALRKRREEFLEYNVFVLDAGEEEMRRAAPHLMMRVCGAGVPGGVGSASVSRVASPVGSGTAAATSAVVATATLGGSGALMDGGAHTDGPDGHVVELREKEREDEERRMRMKQRGENTEGMDMVVDTDGGIDVDAMDVDEDMDQIVRNIQKEQEKGDTNDDDDDDELHLLPNTVDFALREREEMRDLTKASEIISLPPILGAAGGVSTPASSSSMTSARSPKSIAHVDSEGDMAAPVWDPRVGQVYLGNSGDVPLTPDVPSQFRHVASMARAGGEAEVARWDWKTLTSHLRGVDGLLKEYEGGLGELGVPEQGEGEEQEDEDALPEDDPFNYTATNDPVHGFGYDICVECHDLAPFPSAAHLRAAEEHLGMLDVMWRERWERAWAERLVHLSAGKSEAEQARIRSCPAPPTPPRPPPHANAVIHLPFPSSPANSQATMVALMPIVRFLEKWTQPLPVPVITPPPPPPSQDMQAAAAARSPSPTPAPANGAGSRRWSSVTSLMPSFTSFPGVGGSSGNNSNTSRAAPTPPPSGPLPPHPARMRSMTSPSSSSISVVHHSPTPVQARSRPLKILLYSSDGYTESSVPALCLLMAIKSLMLPEAYLELQVEKRRSFFVYQSDLGVLRRVEGRLREEREREKEKERERERERERMAAGVYLSSSSSSTMGGSINANGKRTAGGPVVVPARGGYWSGSGASAANSHANSNSNSSSSSGSTPTAFTGRPAAKSVSFAHAPGYLQQQQQQSQHQVAVSAVSGATSSSSSLASLSRVVSSQQSTSASQFSQKPQFEFGSLPATPASGFTTQQPQPQPQMVGVVKGRPRASTSPWLPSLFGGDHQSWFNDPRFDGSFPSRVLPFLYLGNLNHASNVYMLHALGITHVVSVGECALVPPPHHMSMHGGGGGSSGACHRPGPGAHFVPGKGPGGHGSLWIEEREGRIKVLDIKGVCDDGIDTLEPQLEPICDWIDKARQEGGQVLVHCRVGVSRSATVTIAYVMKHLSLPLVDAYLIVRSRRLSVLIQPNMRLLYNLCGWEIKLAKERAGGDERKLKKELARTLTWPYLSKEVHALNEKYLH
ncbi:hypothetical protein CVT25_007281 [Psilocybe cyanescens]|uniref:Uncharacterized protein n=1 Tax=Psilocybe cyanescens TaxID=93625 RepID=A0A409XP83_PSICY|nr:hypothetical protein CVT25_007281 [Psilocybe cyanescens]